MVQLIHPLQGFGNTRLSITSEVSGASPGETPPIITLDDKQRFFSVTLRTNGKTRTRKVPMTNVAHFEDAPEVEVKKEVKK
jgi:hypothetical protein